MTTSAPAVDPSLLEEVLGSLPDELPTLALVRDVELPAGAGTMALVTLDNGADHTKPSTFGPRGLLSLQQALAPLAERARAGEIVAVGVTGKPFIFAVGADLGMVTGAERREQALAVGRLGHQAFGALGELPVPTFAFINGAAMGGGLEIALHCTYRTLSTGAGALALPECFLGLVPGWGGTYLLPHLIGPAAALQVMVHQALNNNSTLKPAAALQLGIADVQFAAADFLESSLAWAADVLRGEVEVSRPAPVDGTAWQEAVAETRAFLDGKIAGAAPAPYRALDLVAAAETADRATAFAAEDEALADLAFTEQLHAGLYAFDLVGKRARRPVGAPDRSLARPVTSVGVVGAGLMAGQLALLFLRQLKVPVVLTDLDQTRVDRGVQYVRDEIATLHERGRIDADTASRLAALVHGSTDPAAFAGADVVIEAVFEELAVKKQVFAQVEAVVSDTCLVLTNTSSLSVTEMAADLRHPERVVGFHFFNPVAVLPLLEIVRAEQTDEASLATAFALAKAIKKTAVLVKDAPAFVVNRLLTRFLGVVTDALDAGTDPHVADRALAPLGLPMSPFVLLQLVGPAIALHVAQTLHGHYPDRFTVSPNLQRLVAAGKPGIWSFTPEGTPYLDDQTAALFEVGDRPSTEEQVREAALLGLAQEIGVMLAEGVVAGPQEIDLCMITGAGWPFHLGGITPFLDREGYSERAIGRRLHQPGTATLAR